MVKNLPVNAEDLQETRFLSLGREDPLEKEMAATPVLFFFLPGKSHGQRSLAGYSSWDSKESDMLVYYNAIISYIFLYTMWDVRKQALIQCLFLISSPLNPQLR